MMPSNVPPAIIEDGQGLYSIFFFAWFLGTISALSESSACQQWPLHSQCRFYWKDLRAKKLLRS